MLYIVTYATHSERYFETLKKNCTDIIVLGMGTKWNGFVDKAKGVSDFCSTKNPDDIVCFIDGFDSVILEQSQIEKRYTELGHELVFSATTTTINTVFKKYLLDKLFSSCEETGARLNSGMYIGTCKSIIDLWSDFKGGDDQRHVTKKCKDVFVDIDHKLFYNYDISESIEVREGKLYKVGQDTSIPVISCPGNGDMNKTLSQLGYTNLPDIKMNYLYRLKTYGKLFIPEIIWVLVSILLFIKIPNKLIASIISFLILLEVINFEVHIKHLEIHKIRKILYSLLDFVHISVITLLFWLMYKSSNVKTLLIMNTFFLIILALFFQFKKCILTIIENKVAGISDNYMHVPREVRLRYLVDPKQEYKKQQGKSSVHEWINGNKIILFIVVLINIMTLWRVRNSKVLSLQ